MNEKFIPEVSPPVDHPADALCFAFCGDELLVHRKDGGSVVPTLAEIGESSLHIEREHFLGQDTSNGPCFAADLPEDTQAPNGMAFYGLRDLADRLGEDLSTGGAHTASAVAAVQRPKRRPPSAPRSARTAA
jgi:NADH pyrophosphatase NudC (nudix superfamily)